jgi:iron complex transport system permease protein
MNAQPAPRPLNFRRYIGIISAYFLMLVAALLIAPMIGATKIDLLKALFDSTAGQDSADAGILYKVRLPRIFLAAVAGGALAVAGAVYQAVLRNDLAAPVTLGVSGGAALGAVIAIRLGISASPLGIPALTLCSFLGATTALAIVFSMTRAHRQELPTSYLLLAGVTVNFFFSSLVMLVNYMSNITQSFQIVRWLMGGLDITDYATVSYLGVLVAGATVVLMWIARDLNIISVGSEPALSRGVDVVKIQYTGLIVASLITGATVSITGPIGFVGLIVPHTIRLITGPDHRLLIPACVFFGAAFLILCDTAARTILAPTEIPVGVLTSLLGGPFFIWLLRRQR